ncbi:hypothetical protein MKX01_041344 [Papaver californicum]|nr:hypothetical protein MKX01_041344 [Papaver californicum]
MTSTTTTSIATSLKLNDILSCASQLYNFADLDIGLPKIESNEKTIETLVEAPGLATGNNKFGHLAAVQGLLPPHLTIPSGWRPGMPV